MTETAEIKPRHNRMPLRMVPKEPLEFTENKLPGAISMCVVVKDPLGLSTIKTDASRATFSMSGDNSVVAVVHTFSIAAPLKSETFEERIKRFRQKNKGERLAAYVAPWITEENFPFEKKGNEDYQMHVVCPKRRFTSEEAISLLAGDKIWMRSGLFEELVDFGVAFPLVQRIKRVTALGSTAKTLKKSGDQTIEVEVVGSLSVGISHDSPRRMLVTIPWKTIHPAEEGFLAVSKWKR